MVRFQMALILDKDNMQPFLSLLNPPPTPPFAKEGSPDRAKLFNRA